MTSFEQATLETLVSYKAKSESDIERLLSCEKQQHEAVSLCQKWNAKRAKAGLEPWI